MMLKDGTEEVEDGTAKTGVVKNQDGRCLVTYSMVGLPCGKVSCFCEFVIVDLLVYDPCYHES